MDGPFWFVGKCHLASASDADKGWLNSSEGGQHPSKGLLPESWRTKCRNHQATALEDSGSPTMAQELELLKVSRGCSLAPLAVPVLSQACAQLLR